MDHPIFAAQQGRVYGGFDQQREPHTTDIGMRRSSRRKDDRLISITLAQWRDTRLEIRERRSMSA